MASVVYIANRVSSIPYDKAEQYGNFKNVTTGYVKFKDIRSLSLDIMRMIEDSKISDYLILSGNNLVCSLVFSLWLTKHGVVNVLHWDNGDYRVISMHQSSLTIVS